MALLSYNGGTHMKEYHKIATLYNRSMSGNRKLIEGEFSGPTVEYLKDNQWIFTEKIDGTNVRVLWDGHTVTFGGRTDKAEIPKPLQEELDLIFENNTMEEMLEQIFGEKQVLIFGEGYGEKIGKYGSLYRSGCGFIVFDIMIDEVLLERKNVEEICKNLGLDIVPIMLVGTLEDAVKFVKQKPASVISENTKEIEGVVGVPAVPVYDRMGKRTIVKIKICDFQ